jgi:chemotaxis protein methyltransferase CheR
MTATIAAPDFDFLRSFVHKRAAIVLDDGKEYLAVSRLEPIAREAGLASVSDLVAQLRQTHTSPLHSQVIDAMTTNETSFFRDIRPYDSLRQHVLPELIERNRNQRNLSIWCAASSSGQEPYSVAMLIHDEFPELAGWRVSILATDISPTMLERTRQGLYSQFEVNRGLPAKLLVTYFTREGASWRIANELRRMVRVQALNLAGPWPHLPPIDLVLLRNVLIYFDIETKQSILGRARQVLGTDGLLLLGGSETTINLDDRYERIQHGAATWYRPTTA